MQSKKRDYPWRYSWFIIAYYVANAMYQGYISLYFENAGMTGMRFNLLMAAPPAIAIIMQPVWGIIGDRAKSRNAVIRAAVVVALPVMLLFRADNSFAWLMAMNCLFAAGYTSIQPMGDSIILEALTPGNKPFGPLRLTGCLSFAVMNLLFGYLVEGSVNWAVYMTAVLLVGVFVSTYSLPVTAGHQSGGGRKMNLSSLIRQKRLMGLMGLLMLLQLTMGYFYANFSNYFKCCPTATARFWACVTLCRPSVKSPFCSTPTSCLTGLVPGS